MRAGEASTGEELTFNEWVLSRMQAVPHAAVARVPPRPPAADFGAAARSIQGVAEEARAAAAEAAHSPEAVVAGKLQRAWRRFTNRQIFRYFRDMILFHEQGDAAQLLKSINPREARLADIAAGIHVRFRLGGVTFPPTVYYKVYTHAPVSDIGAFAPRDYTAHKQAPVIATTTPSRAPEAAAGTLGLVSPRREQRLAARRREGVARHRPGGDGDGGAAGGVAPPKLKRRDELRQRKQKKVAWMQKMTSRRAPSSGRRRGRAAARAAISRTTTSTRCCGGATRSTSTRTTRTG